MGAELAKPKYQIEETARELSAQALQQGKQALGRVAACQRHANDFVRLVNQGVASFGWEPECEQIARYWQDIVGVSVWFSQMRSRQYPQQSELQRQFLARLQTARDKPSDANLALVLVSADDNARAAGIPRYQRITRTRALPIERPLPRVTTGTQIARVEELEEQLKLAQQNLEAAQQQCSVARQNIDQELAQTQAQLKAAQEQATQTQQELSEVQQQRQGIQQRLASALSRAKQLAEEAESTLSQREVCLRDLRQVQTELKEAKEDLQVKQQERVQAVQGELEVLKEKAPCQEDYEALLVVLTDAAVYLNTVDQPELLNQLDQETDQEPEDYCSGLDSLKQLIPQALEPLFELSEDSQEAEQLISRFDLFLPEGEQVELPAEPADCAAEQERLEQGIQPTVEFLEQLADRLPEELEGLSESLLSLVTEYYEILDNEEKCNVRVKLAAFALTEVLPLIGTVQEEVSQYPELGLEEEIEQELERFISVFGNGEEEDEDSDDAYSP